jgi:hypothetical protein
VWLSTKVKNPYIFGKLNNPLDTILKPEKEDMFGKTRTDGNPNLTFTNGKKTQWKKQHKHRRKLWGANALPIFST